MERTMARLHIYIIAGLLACLVAGTAQAQNSYRGSTPAEIKERFRTDPQFAARYHTFEPMTARPKIISGNPNMPRMAEKMAPISLSIANLHRCLHHRRQVCKSQI